MQAQLLLLYSLLPYSALPYRPDSAPLTWDNVVGGDQVHQLLARTRCLLKSNLMPYTKPSAPLTWDDVVGGDQVDQLLALHKLVFSHAQPAQERRHSLQETSPGWH